MTQLSDLLKNLEGLSDNLTQAIELSKNELNKSLLNLSIEDRMNVKKFANFEEIHTVEDASKRIDEIKRWAHK